MSQPLLDKSAIQSYSVALSEKLCTDYFSRNQVITGEEIVRFTDIEQLNFFILMNLFDRWKEEITHLKSPFFNFEDEEVVLALKTFVNKLSRHIAVRKEFFRPLVQKSIADTLTYLLNPASFMEQELSKSAFVSKEDILEKQKFFKLSKDSYQRWIEELNEISGIEVPVKEALALYQKEVASSPSVSYSDPVVDKFNQLLKLNIQVGAKQQTTVDKFVKPAETTTTRAAEDTKKPETKQTVKGEGMLNEKFAKQQLTINENLKFTEQSGTSIADRLSKSKIEDIKSSIPLNMKFLFINVLFDGKANEYNDALAMIEECPDFDSARNVLTEKYGIKNNWNNGKEEADEFFKIIERKFY